LILKLHLVGVGVVVAWKRKRKGTWTWLNNTINYNNNNIKSIFFVFTSFRFEITDEAVIKIYNECG
jgi:hypothetical protein